MKKFFAVLMAILFFSVAAVMAQQGGNRDTTGMHQRQWQQLKESGLNLTDVQTDSVLSIMAELRQQMGNFRDMSQDERRQKMKEMSEYRMKRWTQALNDEALAKKISDYYEKERAKRMNGGGR